MTKQLSTTRAARAGDPPMKRFSQHAVTLSLFGHQKHVDKWTGETLVTGASTQIIPRMFPKILCFIMRTNSRADAIQRTNNRSGNVY